MRHGLSEVQLASSPVVQEFKFPISHMIKANSTSLSKCILELSISKHSLNFNSTYHNQFSFS
jgi:hypothetical protein